MKNLENLNLQELSFEEQVNTEGGFLPIAVIYGCWLAMGASSAVTVGLYAGYHNNK